MFDKTIAELSSALAKKETSSVELTKLFLSRIEKLNPILEAVTTVCADSALEQAAKADERIAKGVITPLTGIPMLQKDIFCTKGVRTTCGSKMLEPFISPYDATIVEKLNQAGMVMLGKANMDEFAMGSSNETSYYGAARNPWNTECVPGGSSGGSSSAVAARLAPLATGTDTGGSIRQPASLTNITGLKPTYGRCSRFGMIAFASSLDQAGPMTYTAEDAALVLNQMAGYDSKDSTSIDHPVPDYTADLGKSLKGKKIGIVKEHFEYGLDAEMTTAFEAAKAELEKLGATFVDVSLPHSKYSVPVYYIVASAECSSNLSRYDGVRFTHRCENPKNLLDLYERSRAEGFGAEVKRRIMIGTYALSAGYFDAYYLQAQRVRQLIANDFEKAFEQVDMLMGPTTTGPAFKLGEKTKDPVEMYLSDVFTIATNLAGLPGLSMPMGFSKGMPVGAQLIGPHWGESALLNVAHQYQQVTDWHRKVPECAGEI